MVNPLILNSDLKILLCLTPDDSAVKLAKQTSRHKREEDVKEKVRSIYERAPNNVKRVLDLSSEKGSSIKGSFVMPSN